HLDGLVGELCGIDLRVLPKHVLDLMTNLADRIERGPRILEHHRYFAPAQLAHLILARRDEIKPAEMHRALRNAAGAIEDAHHGKCAPTLAVTRVPDDAHRLAFGADA